MEKATHVSLFLFLAVSSLLSSVRALDDPLYTLCSNSGGNYTASDLYAQSLTELASTFLERLELQPAVGFTIPAGGSGDSIAYGLAMCRHRIPHASCVSCVSDAMAHLRRACPSQREAITWYDTCMVRYAARNFYGVVEDGFKLRLWNNEVVPDPTSFNAKVVNLLRRVSSEAYGNEFWQFGTEEADVMVGGRKEKVYSMAQCTMDLKPKDCQRCLKDLLAEFPSCCDGKRGGRVLTASCHLQYELYRFYS